MLNSPNFKMTFNFAIANNIAITTLKFTNKVGANMWGNGVLKFKKATQSIFGLKNKVMSSLVLIQKELLADVLQKIFFKIFRMSRVPEVLQLY